MIRVEWDARIFESAILAALDGKTDSQYHRERDGIYGTGDAEARERAFADLDARWFHHLALDRPVIQALADHPLLANNIESCVIARAARTEDEGAELFGHADALPPRLLIRLRPSSFSDPDALRALLRRELLYVSDMIDPTFGYCPDLPASPAGQTQDRLVMDRYALLWQTTVLGRLSRDGGAASETRARARERLMSAFAPDLFERLFDGPRPSHDELVDLARGAHRTDASCALCGMPTRVFAAPCERDLQDRICLDFPAWRPSQSICLQCAGLYEAKLEAARSTITTKFTT